jgi:pimeloyl-ACP methyl ester carboxylesterase
VKTFLVALILWLAAGPGPTSWLQAAELRVSPKVFSAEPIGRYDRARLNAIVNAELRQFLTGSSAGFDRFKGRLAEPRHEVDLYRIRYLTVVPELGNRSVSASGLIALPVGAGPTLPLLSYQHGTVFEKDSVPSRPDQSMETRLVLAQFASQGYAMIATDYLGLGESDLPNSYFVMQSIEQASFDLYAAALSFLEQQGRKASALATLGWSQGGYSNMIILRKLEREGIPVAASVTAAGAVDLGLFIVRGITNPRPIEAVFRAAALSNMLFALEHYRQLPGLATEALRPEFFPTARAFYEFKIGFGEYMSRIPIDPNRVLRPAFIAQMVQGQGPFVGILDQSASYRWLSRTPLRAYYGGRDEAVPDFIARLAVDYQQTLGKQNGQALSAGADADHRDTFVHALIDAKPWIDQQVKQ